MSLMPPARRIWWNTPIHKIEAVWVAIALGWCLILFLWMPYFHLFGEQNLSNEAYRVTPQAFQDKAQAMVDKYTIRTETDSKIPVVKPPPGSDVYMVGGGWNWWPILELEKGKTYRMHLSSLDYQHGFSIQPVNINLQILPGYDTVFSMTPTQTGEFGVICNEFCGIGHHNMLGMIYVK